MSLDVDSLDRKSVKHPIFAVQAERNAAYATGVFQWAFGNGQPTVTGGGYILAFNCRLIALGLSSRSGETPIVTIYKNNVGTGENIQISTGNKAFRVLTTPVLYNAGDEVIFQTVTANGGGIGVVTAFFEII